jgi:hypothetical protein
MHKLLLRNRDHRGAVWIDARLSDANTPFDDLNPLPGFPRRLAQDEIVEVAVADLPELLYRRSAPGEERMLCLLYRIALPQDVDEIKGDIWSSVP